MIGLPFMRGDRSATARSSRYRLAILSRLRLPVRTRWTNVAVRSDSAPWLRRQTTRVGSMGGRRERATIYGNTTTTT